MSGSLAAHTWDRVAMRCLDEVVSPLDDSVSHPLVAELERIPGREALVAADLGCGTGTLLPRLVRSFRRVIALDASPRMLELARARMAGEVGGPGGRRRAELEFHLRSLTALAPLRAAFDVAITQNAVLMPEPDEIQRVLRGIARSLRPGGIYFGVFPAIESIAEEFQFVYRRQRRTGKDRASAHRAASRQLRLDRVDFALGTYRTRYMRQKYYSQHELATHLAAAGFAAPRFDRVIYRPSLTFNHATPPPRGRPRVWHWFVACGGREG